MPTHKDVLNPTLYRALRRRYGKVRVSHAGEPMVAMVLSDTVTGRPTFQIRRWGEMYYVACLFCHDTGQSLAVSHRYGQLDGLGRCMTYAAFCNHGRCLAEVESRDELFEMLSPYGLENAIIRRGHAVSRPDGPVALPESMTRLDRLRRGHPARRYLCRLGLDPGRVGRAYGIGYCDHATESLVRGKVIIPYRRDGVIRGWQALPVSTAGMPPPRFLTAPGMRISRAIYNIDRARDYQTGVIVPTPIDVWRFGPMAMSLPSREITTQQWSPISPVFARRSLVLLASEADLERPEVKEMIRFFRYRMPGSFLIATLPDGRYPEALDRDDLRNLVLAEAVNVGARVRFHQTP